MTAVEPDKRSLIVLPGSKVRKNHRSKITKYEFVRGGLQSVVKRNVKEVLASLDIDTDEDKRKFEEMSTNNTVRKKENKQTDGDAEMDEPDYQISNELTEAIVNGLKGLTVHNDGGNRPIEKEITLFTLFPAINSLNRLYIDQAYDNVKNECNLTMNALKNFYFLRCRYSQLETSPYVLVKMLKIWNHEYYTDVLEPILEKEKPLIQNIDLHDEFMLADIKEKSEKGLYTQDNAVITDLSRVLRFVVGADNVFLVKTFDARKNRYIVSYSKDDKMYKYMKSVRLWTTKFEKNKKKTVYLYDIFNKYESMLTVRGVSFNSDDKRVFSVFQGFKWKVLDRYNWDVIAPYMNLIKEVICDNNDETYEYILNWISVIVQKPGFKTEVALVLKGLQGIGKGTFTDILCELFNGYSSPNVTDITELTGTFNSVVENKMLIILNELKNCGEERGANWNALKSIITENEIRINEKNMARRDGENVANFIFVTNNAFPVKIENGDRRYLVLRANGKYKGDYSYFENLHSLLKNDNFFDNLLTFFMKRNIVNFNVRQIPMTDAKEDIIKAGLSPIEIFICQYYDELVKGMPNETAKNRRPYEYKTMNSFTLQLKEKCDYKRKKDDKGKTYYAFVLKDECKPIYEKMKDEFEKEKDDDFFSN